MIGFSSAQFINVFESGIRQVGALPHPVFAFVHEPSLLTPSWGMR